MFKLDKRRFFLLLGPILFLVIRLWVYPVGLSVQANAVLATTVWMALWWVMESVPIAVTALLPIVLFPLAGGLSLSETTAQFGHKYVFLYLGGFVLAISIERWNVHRRIALFIIRYIGTRADKIILGFMIATALLSMWISNTATSVMMLPIGMAIIRQLKDNPTTHENENQIFGKALMLAIAYSASIGGIATLVGTPPNLVLAGVVSEYYGTEISFAKWFAFGFPISVLLLITCWYYLTRFAFTLNKEEIPGGRQETERLYRSLGRVSYEEKTVLVIFVLTALAWMTRPFLQKWVGELDDTIIAMIAMLVLFVVPSSDGSRSIVCWEEAVSLPWGIILLFGGGMALAQGFQQSGLAQYIANLLSLLEGISLLVIILVVIAGVNFLTEVTSNLATTAMLLPILATLSVTLGVDPYILLLGATLAASCAFMLPVATPPNAVVFGSGYLSIVDMVRAGLMMNIISIIFITLLVYYILPYWWGF